MYKIKRALLAIILAVLGLNNAIAQCPMCKTAVTSNLENDASNVGLGLNGGILYLLAAPYLLVGFLIFMWLRHRRLQQKSKIA